jgi:uncharacterized protein YndB with AHSA1/START domain
MSRDIGTDAKQDPGEPRWRPATEEPTEDAVFRALADPVRRSLRLWQALTDSADIRRYFYGGSFESAWQPGAAYRTFLPDGTTPFEGTVLEIDPPRRLVYSFHYVGDSATRPEHPSRVSWEITPLGDVRKLTVVHDGFAAGELATYRLVGGVWPFILSSLKTLLETGEPLHRPATFPLAG